MNSIEKLVAKLCPDGVEFKKLADVMTLHRGISYKKTDEDEDGPVKVLRANNITLASNTLNFDDVKVVSSSVRVRPDQFVKNKDIIISVASGSKEHVGKVAFITRQNVGYSFGAFMAIIRVYEMILNPKFLFHLLTGNSFESYLQSKIKFTTINNLSAKILGAFPVPIPPLEIQQEIVNILDTFTELLVELEAELEARRLQYQYYRDELLNFSGAPSAIHRSLGLHSTDNVEFKALGEIAILLNGYSFKSNKYTDKGIRVIRISDVQKGRISNKDLKFYSDETREEISRYLLSNNDLVMSLTGNVGRVAMLSETELPAALNQRVTCIRAKSNKILTRFLFFIFDQNIFEEDAMRSATGGGQKNLSIRWLEKYRIPVPPLQIQQEIVSILDKFEALINDLSIGLPAEIDARRKQYEYYRDKLLTFKEKGVYHESCG